MKTKELQAKVAQLEKALLLATGANSALIEYRGHDHRPSQYVPIPCHNCVLRDAVYGSLANLVSGQACCGSKLADYSVEGDGATHADGLWQDIFEIEDMPIGFNLWLVTYTYDRLDGTCIQNLWQLRKV